MFEIGTFIRMLYEKQLYGKSAADEMAYEEPERESQEKNLGEISENMENMESICSIGRNQGWLEEQDTVDLTKQLDRRSCARILHMYRMKVLGIKDVEDITSAYELRDIFDCRICTNHIAQIVLSNIMEPVTLGGLRIFDVYGEVSEEEARRYISHLNQV